MIEKAFSFQMRIMVSSLPTDGKQRKEWDLLEKET
jgi:hypothetical protein